MCSDDACLDVATSIGRRIMGDAVWHNGLCSWTGVVAVDPARPWRTQYRALEPILYDGTAGVGLFLAQLAAVTGDAAVRHTAVGAVRHAVARARAMPPARRDGFHAGSLGIAWAAARAAALLNEEELHAGAATVPVVASPAGADRCPDVVSGSAGSILALLALADAFDDPALLEEAVATGEELIDRATVTRNGWSWANPNRRRRHQLCGLSHGAAGIGWALLELYAVTGDERFGTGARGAFAYERSWLDAESGTWPDLRIGGQRRGTTRRITSPAVGTWCHGEGGIALTRLRAIDVLGRDACVRDAEVALEATRRHVAAALPFEIADLSLCHGVAGAADVLLCGATALGERWRDAAELAAELGRVAVERYANTGVDWPCDSATGTTPGLFRGLSGIAWWLLRLHDQAIPSPLRLPDRG
jgi:lantibiotic biosynthesis protein